MKKTKKNILNELKKMLQKHLGKNIEKVILFGSQAANTSSEYSDYDILIILRTGYDWHTKNEIFSLCYEIDLKYDILIDAKIISLAELRTLRGKQPFVLKALEGINIGP